jgi:acetyl esterase/lipase
VSQQTRPAWRLHPDLEPLGERYRRVDHADPVGVRREAARRLHVTRLAGLWRAADPHVDVEDITITGRDGHRFALRVYRPTAPATSRRTALYLHGGAFLSGDLDFEHSRCLDLCRETGFVVVAVDYRLAPEHPYPAALHDCLDALAWIRAHGPAAGAADGRVALAGASAGGALVAAMCLRIRDTGMPPADFQMLIYPVTDDRMTTRSMRLFTDTPVWDRSNNAHMWDHYLGPLDRTAVSGYAAPARAEDLSGLPPAYVLTAGCDPLRDEGAEYANRLTAAGVATELHQFPGACHGFDTLSDAPIARRARREQAAALRDALR